MQQVQITTFAPLALHDVQLPRHVKIRVAREIADLAAEAVHAQLYGFVGTTHFGMAFIQGGRLQFTTAMSVDKMMSISKVEQAGKKAGVKEVVEKSNRPYEAPHGKALRNYLEQTACMGLPYVLPAFTFNYGCRLEEQDPDAILIICAPDDIGEASNGWPAMLLLPQMAKLDTTDGGHRRREHDNILGGRYLQEMKDRLRQNAVDVKIIFESNPAQSHQDFADCAKAKAISKSLVATYDIRDTVNLRCIALVEAVPFLEAYADATASHVNLSMYSTKVWSMSAVRSFVSHVQKHSSPADEQEELEPDINARTQGAEDFFEALVRHVPQLRALDEVRLGRRTDIGTGDLRERRGGNILMRSVGMTIFARAFLHRRTTDMSFEMMARRLAKVDWHVLDCERSDLPDTSREEGRRSFSDAVRDHAVSLWAHMLIVGEARYRISSSADDADVAWETIRKTYVDPAPEPDEPEFEPGIEAVGISAPQAPTTPAAKSPARPAARSTAHIGI